MSLLDVGSKIISVVLSGRAQELLLHNGNPMQFGATPNVGCADAVLSLKSMLQSRREHGTDSSAVFKELVKAHDSLREDVVSAALVNMGTPPKCA